MENSYSEEKETRKKSTVSLTNKQETKCQRKIRKVQRLVSENKGTERPNKEVSVSSDTTGR